MREQLEQAQATIKELREGPCRHDREEAVLAEAIAITEQALAAEQERGCTHRIAVRRAFGAG
ncbi:hypothetical protein AB0E88_04100 [Streptomyces sp. NPDC028635]|uniref:hypothetical protein n=1 Tax=Streptomyces sp. NPDC028635 TaxID=3154800 RepID=UPI0033D3C4B2